MQYATSPQAAHQQLFQAIEQVPTSQQTQVQQNKQLIQTIEQAPASQPWTASDRAAGAICPWADHRAVPRHRGEPQWWLQLQGAFRLHSRRTWSEWLQLQSRQSLPAAHGRR